MVFAPSREETLSQIQMTDIEIENEVEVDADRENEDEPEVLEEILEVNDNEKETQYSAKGEAKQKDYNLRESANLKRLSRIDSYEVAISMLHSEEEPTTYDTAINSIDSHKRKEAIQQEINAREENETWTFTDRTNNN